MNDNEHIKEQILSWISFCYVLAGVPTLSSMCIHAFILKDFVATNFSEDMLLFAISVIPNACGAAYGERSRLNSNQLFFVFITSIVFFIALVIAYMLFFIISFIEPDDYFRKIIFHVSVVLILVYFFMGIIMPITEKA